MQDNVISGDFAATVQSYTRNYTNTLKNYTRLYDKEHLVQSFRAISLYPTSSFEDFSLHTFGNPHIKWLLCQIQLKVLGVPHSVSSFLKLVINDMLFIISVVC